ncbi:hypothetical protein Nepgr_007100 [Nepenthes gracilis]|uniref:mannan endo-1,4-beta-mannosidase n=1 Tax=Nepenthes gracilis TaxID=150966 RepID=A0AAD3S6C0_NEPGR|nr:hypothetical protein Nepgr_007100 [Nepenthes gracilis]
MDSQWREKYVYPIIGIASVLTILYLNFSDQFQLPIVLWQPDMGFVGTNSTHFVVINGDGKLGQDPSPVYINGWNSYWLMEESVYGPSRSRVSMMLKRGAQMGLTLCRTWAFSDGPGPNSLQISPGVVNERVFKGLDYVIIEARKNRIRLILSLVNNLNAFGGKAQYLRWAQEVGINVSSSTDSFFSNPTIKGYYKAYIKAILTRKNSYSGVKYSEEPAIFAWELMNEPRCESSSSAPVLQAWIVEMAAYIKSLDQKHLVTIGLEGFYGPKETNKSQVNPGEWASSLGSDFIENSAIDDIDFASVHAYPDSWIPNANLDVKLAFLSQWVDSHIVDGDNLLKKPVLFTEVGSPIQFKSQGEEHDRDILLKRAYEKMYDSAKSGRAGAGALIWQLLVEGMEEYGDRFSIVPWEHPSIYKLIVEQSCRLRNAFGKSKTNRKLDVLPFQEEGKQVDRDQLQEKGRSPSTSF